MNKFVLFLGTLLLIVVSILLVRSSIQIREEYQTISIADKEDLGNIKNVILIIACSLRADHLGCYGYGRKTSPNIDELAKDGVLFNNCFAQAPFTVHSVASIMTSHYPRKLFGIDHNYAIIPDQAKTCAEFFNEEGFYTMGFMASPWTSKPFNFHQGFDYFFDTAELLDLYKTEEERRANRVWGDELTGKIINKLNTINQRFFLQVMYTDVHSPYTSFPPFKGKYQRDKQKRVQVDRYDETILHFDSYVGQLVETLRDRNVLDNTLIIITSDHGEAFGKLRRYDRGHSALLYNTVIKVPLIFYNPSLPVKGMSINKHVTSMDILPTILDVMGIQYNQQSVDGISQRELFKRSDASDTSTRLIVSETNFKNMQKGMMRSCALWNQRWKLIYNHVRTFLNYNGKFPLYELYDLKNDPNELNNIFDKKRDMAEQIISLFQDWQKKNTSKLQNDTTHEKFSMENIDPTITNQLKALGYID